MTSVAKIKDSHLILHPSGCIISAVAVKIATPTARYFTLLKDSESYCCLLVFVAEGDTKNRGKLTVLYDDFGRELLLISILTIKKNHE